MAWDRGGAPFPALRRFMVKRPDVCRCLPTALGARPGTRYLEATTTGAYGDQVLVALDPGGAEKVAHMLGHAMEGKYTPATPLTSAKLRSAQAIVKARKTEAVGRASRDAATSNAPPRR